MSALTSPLLDAEHTIFITGPVSMNVAACGVDGFPALARAVGCRVSEDGYGVTIILSAVAGADVLAGVRQNAAVAVVFSEPHTHRTVQLKGCNAKVLPPDRGDAMLAERYRDGFTAVLVSLGYAETLVRAFLASAPEDLMTISFEPRAAFSQTPGPHAGEALGAGA